VNTKRGCSQLTLDHQSYLCPLSSSEDFKDIINALDKKCLLDTLITYILKEDILVPRIALENNYTIFRRRLVELNKSEFPRNLPKEIKIGKFTRGDDEIILQNWNMLLSRTNLDQGSVEHKIFVSSGRGRKVGLKKNVIGYYLSQDLSSIRLATDVIQRARVLRCLKTGPFTTEEDKIILQFIEEEKDGSEWSKWEKLSMIMSRNSNTLKNRYKTITVSQEMVAGSYTLEEDKSILRELLKMEIDVLDPPSSAFVEISALLQRTPRSLIYHWHCRLLPMLKRYLSGTWNKDFKEVLINHLLENNIEYAQDVNWKDLSLDPKFKGSTPRYLQGVFNNVRQATKRKYPKLSPSEVNTLSMKTYLLNSKRMSQRRIKNEEYVQSIGEFYLALCNK